MSIPSPQSVETRPLLLIVTADTTVLNVARGALAGGDAYELVLVQDGVTGLEAIARRNPQLIVIDFMIPRISGWQLCETIRAEALSPHTPLLLLTGTKPQPNGRIHCNERVVDIIQKPVAPKQLREIVQRWLPSSQAHGRDMPKRLHRPDPRRAIEADLKVSLRSGLRRGLDKHMKALCATDTQKSTSDVINAVVNDTVHWTGRAGSLRRMTQFVHQTSFDPVTHLPNRQRLLRHLNMRLGDRRKAMVLAVLDIENLPLLAEALGQGARELAVLEVASRLHAALRPEDLLARVDQVRLAIAFGAMQARSEAMDALAFMRDLASGPLRIAGEEVYVSIRAGLTQRTESVVSGEDLLHDGEIALAQARSRRTWVAFFERPMRQEALDVLRMDAALRRAIQNGELEVFYQPIVSTREGHILGFEALTRWRSPRYGLLPPAKFLPLASQNGMLEAIARLTQEHACQQVATWNRAFTPNPQLSININVVDAQLRNPRFVMDIQSIVETAGLEPTCVKLELLEDVLIQDQARVERILLDLQSLGFRVGLDDFGTGYSSLSYVHHLPFDFIKIDRSFVESIETDPKADLLVRSVLAISEQLGVAVVGEGVETAGQRARLQELGCEMMQGYYFSRPTPARAAEDLLRLPSARPRIWAPQR